VGEEAAIGAMVMPKNGEATARQSTGYCAEARRLLDEFGETVKELVQLHELQFLSIVEGDPDCGRFDVLIHMANERKMTAKYAYLNHLEAHGC
jgi:hypothetical protein